MLRTSDRFLTLIIVGVLLLVGVAVAVALSTPEPEFRADETPDGVVHNYLLALHRGDYERAYRYLSPSLDGYPPTAVAFAGDILERSQRFQLDDSSSSVAVESVRSVGDLATVKVRSSEFRQRGLFGSGEETFTFEMRLRREGERWYISGSNGGWRNYWLSCWDARGGCQ